jgi:kynurenine formamidase
MSAALSELLSRVRVVDLTYPLTPEFPLFPVYDPVRVAEKFTVEKDGFCVNSWAFDEHCGTHVDAPAHFGGQTTVERIVPEELVLPAVVVDITGRVEHDHDAMALPDDILDWERRHGPLPDRCVLLARTGWAARVHDPAAYLNADESGTMHAPGFSPELTDYLKDERPGVRAVGLDTASLDIGASSDFPAHVSWLPSGRYGIENVANLDQLPAAGAIAIVGAPALAGGSGGPSRILALVS